MSILFLLLLLVLFVYLLPIRKKGGRWDYAPSGLVALAFAALLTLLLLDVIPWGFGSSFGLR